MSPDRFLFDRVRPQWKQASRERTQFMQASTVQTSECDAKWNPPHRNGRIHSPHTPTTCRMKRLHKKTRCIKTAGIGTACHLLLLAWFVSTTAASEPNEALQLLQMHCGRCHSGENAEGDFRLTSLGSLPSPDSVELWETSLDYVKAGEMPPADESELRDEERTSLVEHLEARMREYNKRNSFSPRSRPRRLNNREFANSIRDVLMLEDIGTQQPLDNLIGDALHDGFDTHAETLGFSKFHLEQYIEAIRKIVDATILSGEQTESVLYRFSGSSMIESHTSQNTIRPERRGSKEGFDFLDPLKLARYEGFETAPATGFYDITIRCTGKDRGLYPSDETGIYDDDPIQLAVLLGDRRQVFDLPDEKVIEIRLREWIAKGSRLRLQHPTDGLRMRSNGNFKFQNAITGQYLKQHNRKLYDRVVANIQLKPVNKRKSPESWHNWTDHWMGPRPMVFETTIEGPLFESWPAARQAALIGTNPSVNQAFDILHPIAERAWRRDVKPEELDAIVSLVQSSGKGMSDEHALKEGIVAILSSPPFLLLNTQELNDSERFASKLSYFLSSSMPSVELRAAVEEGYFNSFEAVRNEVAAQLSDARADEFQKVFPYAWLKLNDINFMAPDPDYFHHYHRKRVSEDMIAEALHFFRHATDNNIPIPEFLSADYSFVNADLAKVYGLDDVPQDSQFRKYRFADGRRGGLLGMGAFLTVTADSLGTSPIHRAIYVMENFLGIHPSPPPADVKIAEPDVRSAQTIKQVLAAHQAEKTCASCHRAIDPFGYAFENFDPMGAWRDQYTVHLENSGSKPKRGQAKSNTGVPIDASASFRNGDHYTDILEFRELMQTPANRDRFVRCFITKLLTYANGEAPDDYTAIERILSKSAEHDYRIVETIAAVIDSPLFREQ